METKERKIQNMTTITDLNFKKLCLDHIVFRIKDPHTNSYFEPVLGSIIDNNFFSLRLNKKDVDNKSLLKMINSKELLTGLVNHHNKVIGIKFRMESIIGTDIICHLPESIYEINARSVPRFAVTQGIAPLTALISIPSHSLKPVEVLLFDISVDGFSFVANKEVSDLFYVKKELNIVNIKILGNMITVQGIIMNSYKMDNDMNKFGVKFKKLNLSNTKTIELYLKNLHNHLANSQ